MLKKIIGVGIAIAMVAPFAVGAATVTNVTFSNGDVSISAPVNSTVTGKLHVIIPPNEVGQWLGVKVDGLAEQCTAINVSEGTVDVPFSVLNAPNTGVYNFTYRIAGRWGGIASVDCSDNVIAGNTVGSAVKATGGSTLSPSLGGQSFADLVAAILAAIHPVTPPAPVPTVSASCTAYASANVGTMPGVKNEANVALQGFLLSQHISIPALAAGASFGFYGPQTQAAVSSFLGMNHC